MSGKFISQISENAARDLRLTSPNPSSKNQLCTQDYRHTRVSIDAIGTTPEEKKDGLESKIAVSIFNAEDSYALLFH